MRRDQGYKQVGVAFTCRNFKEYERMFDLKGYAWEGKCVLDVAAGASSFIAYIQQLGASGVAVDPRYNMTPETIYKDGFREIEESTVKLEQISDELDWSYYGSLTAHQEMRMESLNQFYADFLKDRRSQKEKGARYIAASLPNLPFEDHMFDLVICSHFLFLYHEQLSADFHKSALKELIRVSRREVRVYPLVSLAWEAYQQLKTLMKQLEEEESVQCELRKSHLPFIPGSTQQLWITRRIA